MLNVEPNSSPQPTSKTLLDYNVANNIVPENSESVNRNERNSKISEENSIGWEDLKKSLPETDDAGYYNDLQIHAKPRKKVHRLK